MDTRKKTMLTIVLCGSLFVGWRGYSLFRRVVPAAASAAVAPPDTVPVAPPEAPRPTEKDEMASILQAQRAIESQPWGRNPFDAGPFEEKIIPGVPPPVVRASPRPPPAPTVVFTGISRARGRWLAAVNGGIVSIGDIIEAKFQVVEISSSSITFAADGWAFRYELGSKAAEIRPWTEKP